MPIHVQIKRFEKNVLYVFFSFIAILIAAICYWVIVPLVSPGQPVAPTGQVDLSFYPELPQDLRFGDSRETIVDKMRHKSYNEYSMKGGYSYVFNLPTTDNAPGLDKPKFQMAHYAFKRNKLAYATLTGFLKCEDETQRGPAASGLKKFLKILHGPYNIAKQSSESLPGESIYFIFWERPKNALILFPPKYDEETSALFFSLTLCPLKASGHCYSKEIAGRR